MDLFFESDSYQSTAQACLVDLTPPSFAGITALVARPNGSLRATWAAASDLNPPIRYEVYIQAATATGLFADSNRVLVTDKLSIDIFQDSLGNLLENGEEYFVGVRARDAIGNQDSNTVSLSEESTGVPDDNCSSLIIKIMEFKDAVDRIRVDSVELSGILESSELSGSIESPELVGIVEECQ